MLFKELSVCFTHDKRSVEPYTSQMALENIWKCSMYGVRMMVHVVV